MAIFLVLKFAMNWLNFIKSNTNWETEIFMGTTSKKSEINLLEIHNNVTNDCIDESIKISAIQKGVKFNIQNFV